MSSHVGTRKRPLQARQRHLAPYRDAGRADMLGRAQPQALGGGAQGRTEDPAAGRREPRDASDVAEARLHILHHRHAGGRTWRLLGSGGGDCRQRHVHLMGWDQVEQWPRSLGRIT